MKNRFEELGEDVEVMAVDPESRTRASAIVFNVAVKVVRAGNRVVLDEDGSY